MTSQVFTDPPKNVMRLRLEVTSVNDGKVRVTVLMDGRSAGRLVMSPHKYEILAGLITCTGSAEVIGSADPLQKGQGETRQTPHA